MFCMLSIKDERNIKKEWTHNTKLKTPDVISDAVGLAQPVPHGSTELSCIYRTYHILTAQQEPYRIKNFFYKLSLLGKKSGEWTISSSSSSKMLADPSFYSDAYLNFSSYLGCPSTTFSLALFTGWPLCKTEC